MKPNPPIKGHELVNEGLIYSSWTSEGRLVVRGGCRCGLIPDDWPHMSTKAVKAWHRAHKEALRSAGTAGSGSGPSSATERPA